MKSLHRCLYQSGIGFISTIVSFLPLMLTAQTSTFNYATGNVNGRSCVGGLIGRIDGKEGRISDNYARGSVTGISFVGGLAGYTRSTVENSYSTGKITGSLSAGGLLGWCERAVKNSFWDFITSGQLFSYCGTGRSSDEMIYPYASETYTGWDFTNTWNADRSPFQNDGYPMLWVSQVFKVSVQVFPPGSGIISGAGYYKTNQPVFLEAEPNVTFSFNGWQQGNKLISTQNKYSLPVTGNINLVARFESKSTQIQIDRIEPEPELIIWPNPVTDILQVHLLSREGRVNAISVINMLGQTLISFYPEKNDIQPISFPVADLKTGIYLLKIRLSTTCVSGRFYKY